MQIDPAEGDLSHWDLDLARADAYYRLLRALQERYSLSASVPLELMARAEGVVKVVDPDLNEDSLWAAVQSALAKACDQLMEMREQEGAALGEDLIKRIDRVEELVESIQEQAQGVAPLYQARLHRRIDQLTRGKIDIDPVRIAQEVAFQSDRSDISEELVRCRSHIDQFRGAMSAAEPAGRKLNFLLQELNRELNTIGAKAETAEIAHCVVDAKTELEKIREQVQNVE